MKNILNLLSARDFGASGSSFETEGKMNSKENLIELKCAGDFSVGQQIKVYGGSSRCESLYIFGPHGTHGKRRRVEGEVEVQIENGAVGDRTVYILDFDPKAAEVFRWTDDRGRSWHEGVKADREWHSLSDGVKIRLSDFDWSLGWVVTLAVSHSFTAEIIGADGNTLTLNKNAECDIKARVTHSDTLPLQRAIDACIDRGCDLFIPEGHYNLSDSITVKGASSLKIIGSSPERTILDIGNGGVGIEAAAGSCIILDGGCEVGLYDLGFRGASGYNYRDQAGHLPMKGASGVWGFYFMKCNALSTWGTERVYVENCHARGMSAECFYSASPEDRTADLEPKQYTKSITYMRCSVEDCARNAFNNNDLAENTHLIDCRIRDVGGCTWEGASRFVEMRGCYVRNSGCVGIGNVRSRKEIHERLGTAQHIITDNTFEEVCPYGGVMINVGAGASQVIIKNNNFVNFNSNAINVNGNTGNRDLPPKNVIITGNSFNMTAEGSPSRKRTAIAVSVSDVTISDNQIYSDIKDENITAIDLRDDAQGIIIHDNLIRGIGEAIAETEALGVVGDVINERSFYRNEALFEAAGPTTLRRRSHRYRGWQLIWSDGSKSVMEDFDPETCIFTLKEARAVKIGDRFTLKPMYENGTPMNERIIHDNLIL